MVKIFEAMLLAGATCCKKIEMFFTAVSSQKDSYFHMLGFGFGFGFGFLLFY